MVIINRSYLRQKYKKLFERKLKNGVEYECFISTLNLDSVLYQPLFHHGFRDKGGQGLDNAAKHPLPDKIMPYIYRYTPLRQVIAFNTPHILPLLFRKHRQMHLRNYGESAVLIDNAYERTYTASLIYTFPYPTRLAKAECTVAQTL